MGLLRILLVGGDARRRSRIGAAVGGWSEFGPPSSCASGAHACAVVLRDDPDVVLVAGPPSDGSILDFLDELRRVTSDVGVVVLTDDPAPLRSHPALAPGVTVDTQGGRVLANLTQAVHDQALMHRRSAHGPVRRRRVRSAGVRAVVIGVSTGGPRALVEVIPRLPARLDVPVIVVQHMPPEFTGALAARLDAMSAVPVVEALPPGGDIVPGTVYVAHGGYHLEVSADDLGRARWRSSLAPPENACRPAADVLFRTAARAWGPGVLGVVLTGMGADGLLGAAEIRQAGGSIIAQDEATSVVWGMPGNVVEAGLADACVPLDAVAVEIARRLGVPAV